MNIGNNKKIERIAIIMAGGAGERFWPVSSRKRPKQFLRLTTGNKSLLEQTVTNISNVFSKENTFIATGKHLVDSTKEADTGIPVENIISEPFKRNTSGCIALAAAEILARYKNPDNIIMGVFPADHIIADTQTFLLLLDAALTAAEKESAIVTLGIKPDRPETGYGYIQTTEKPEFSVGNVPVYRTDMFCEKPDLKTAEEYMTTGQHFWNSGMFFWNLSALLGELRNVAPELLESVEQMADAISLGDQKRLNAVFERLEDISIDYALMEKADRVLVIKADFGWDDVGAWDALARTVPADEHGNVTIGDSVIIDSENCIVYNEQGPEKMNVGVIGVEGLAVIISGEGVLVLPKEKAQDVRRVVAELKKRNPDDTLKN
ncbi:mannose-1-phosphate guanylyltransferase [Candidatus Latescibacterota bacterium]